MKNLINKTAVITGAGSGIGRALSVELARRGCNLALSDVDEAGLQTTRERVEAEGRKATTYTVDVANRAAMARFSEQVIADHQHVHIVINNAGVSFMDTTEHADIEEFEWIFGINFWGVVYGTKFFLPHLLKEPESHLVNISSVYGLIGVPSQSGYCATKFAVRGFTESLRQEMAGRPVGITAVHPGGVDSNIVKNSRFTQGFDVASQQDLVRHFKRMARTSPERAAQIIVKGIIRNNPRVLVGWDARMLDYAQRLLPVLYPTIVRLMMPKPR